MLRQQKSADTQGNSIDVERHSAGSVVSASGGTDYQHFRTSRFSQSCAPGIATAAPEHLECRSWRRGESDQQKEPRMGGSSCGFGMMSPAHVYRRYLVCGHTLTIITDSPCPGRHRLGHSSPRLSGINVSPIGPLILSRSILPGRKRPPK
jgi:hypothetical protein